jgi:hypothetical protein
MTRQKADAMALVLGGVVVSGPTSRAWAVGVTRPDGKYVLIEDDAGARYFDRHACDVGYHCLGSDPKGEIDAEEWGWPPRHHDFCEGLARLLGGDAWQTGGNCLVVLYARADGQFAVFNDEVGMVFRSEASYRFRHEMGDDEAGDDGLVHEFLEVE